MEEMVSCVLKKERKKKNGKGATVVYGVVF
jgi:hypothetical protein